MGIIRLEPCASIRVDGSTPLPSSTLTIVYILILLFMSGCAGFQVKESCPQEDIRFVLLDRFSVEIESCGGMDVVVWKIEIEVCYSNIWTGTNLWTHWDGCGYKLWQENSDTDELRYIGRFKNLKRLKEFLEITMPMTRTK